ncbi:gp226 [Bacillus phage G]|uniref:Gp226 n=1 Tax=Bacillus phage G TaxID=2884420 RepID=G3M9W7_9CAUD|nr:gp226 [Bacillus phage G]AEO93485.1 gp226 [Bacillus phage G]
MSSSLNKIEKIQKKFLAYLFSDKKFIAASFGRIKPHHLPDCHFIYSLLTGYYTRHKNIITDDVVDIMFNKKNLDANAVVSYKSLIGELRTLLIDNGKFIGDDAEFNALIEELEEIQKRKDYVKIAEQIIETNPLDCSTDKLVEMEKKVKEGVTNITARTGETRKEGTIRDSVNDRREAYRQVKENPESIKAIPTGFSQIDDTNGGFRAGELIYIIGRKGDGKSVALLNFGHNAWAAGYNVIIFTLEISKEDYERRFDARAAGISSNGLKMGKLDNAEEIIYDKYLDNLSKGKVEVLDKESGQQKLTSCGTMYIVDCPSGATPAFVESKIDTVEQLLGIKFHVVITDYSGIMKPNVNVGEKRHEQGAIALDQKRIARERDCVVLSAAQMTRGGAKEKEATTEHVAESDQISDHLDWGIYVRSISETTGVMGSFKTRDAAPFKFHFAKKYSMMKMVELEDQLANWDNLEGIE